MAYLTFHQHLATISGIANHIQWALDSFPTSPPKKDTNLKFSLHNYLHILICSFLDAWNELEGMGSDPKIRETLYIISPAIKRMRIWPGLRKVRSQLLAHHLRNENGAFVQPWDVFKRFEAPTAYAETIALGNCALIARDTLLRRHSDEWEEALAQLYSQDRRIDDKGVMTRKEAKEECAAIYQEIGERERNPTPSEDEGTA